MSVPRSVAEILSERVTLTVECIDRLYLNCYVPRLQRALGVAMFFRSHRGEPVASSVLMGRISDAFIREIERFTREHEIPLIRFEKGQRKEDIAKEYRRRFPQPEGVLLVGKAQEKVSVFRTEKRTDAQGEKYPWIVRSTALVNQLCSRGHPGRVPVRSLHSAGRILADPRAGLPPYWPDLLRGGHS